MPTFFCEALTEDVTEVHSNGIDFKVKNSRGRKTEQWIHNHRLKRYEVTSMPRALPPFIWEDTWNPHKEYEFDFETVIKVGPRPLKTAAIAKVPPTKAEAAAPPSLRDNVVTDSLEGSELMGSANPMPGPKEDSPESANLGGDSEEEESFEEVEEEPDMPLAMKELYANLVLWTPYSWILYRFCDEVRENVARSAPRHVRPMLGPG